MTAIELIIDAVHTMSAREQQVLSMLYGFGGGPQHSPEELSHQLNAPLKRIVKTEAAALRKLRHPIPRKAIMKALEEGEQEIWNSLSLSGDLVLKKDIPMAVPERMPREFLLAIKYIIGTVDQWLNDHSFETPKAWYRGRFSREQLVGTIERLERIHKQIRLPTPLSLLLKILQVDLELLLAAVALADFSSIFKGYFAKSSMGIRVARAVHLHQIMSLELPHQPFTTGQLAAVYNERHPDDPVTAREAEIILHGKPHLFLPMGYMVWSCIEPITEDMSDINCGTPPLAPELDRRILRHLPGRQKLEIYPEDVLHRILAARGPSRLQEIAREFVRTVGDSRNLHILKTTLGGSHKIVALAPELYALEEQVGSAMEDPNLYKLLLTHRQCCLYVLARHAGEPMDAYPLWTPLMEERWCTWAQQNPRQKLFPSLLAVVDPQLWGQDAAIKAAWSSRKILLGHYCLGLDLKASIWENKPSLLQLLAAATCTKQSGYVNWLRVGTVLGLQLLTRMYDQDAAPILAILIGLNAVTAPDHWQKAHYCMPELDEFLTPLSHELHKRGKIRWTDALGIELISRLETACRRTDLGWVDTGALATLVKALTGEEAGKKDHARPGKEKPARIPDKDKPFRQLTMSFKNPNK